MNRRDVLNGLAMLAGVAAVGSAAEESNGAWPDSVFHLESAKKTEAAFGSTMIFHDGPTAELGEMVAGCCVLNAGQEPHPPHQHPEEEFMLVTEGQGTILVNGNHVPAGPGTLIYCEGNHEHGIKNTGATPLRFYFFKWSARRSA